MTTVEAVQEFVNANSDVSDSHISPDQGRSYKPNAAHDAAMRRLEEEGM